MIGFIERVNAELKRRRAGLHVSVGWKSRSEHRMPPSIAWVVDAAEYGDPLPREDRLSQSFAGRVVRCKVECWGDTPADTNALVKAVVRACHRVGSGASYAVEGEEWEGLEGSGGAILGELATLTVGVRDDVDDDDDAAVPPPVQQQPPSGGFEP